jgi:hypothetical protein
VPVLPEHNFKGAAVRFRMTSTALYIIKGNSAKSRKAAIRRHYPAFMTCEKRQVLEYDLPYATG